LWDVQVRRELLFCPVGWGNLKERDNLEHLGIGVSKQVSKVTPLQARLWPRGG
jgi:hypothetical protein